MLKKNCVKRSASNTPEVPISFYLRSIEVPRCVSIVPRIQKKQSWPPGIVQCCNRGIYESKI